LKVQRLSRNGVHLSRWKRFAPCNGDDDIVYSIWKHIAVHKRTGGEVTYLIEYKDAFLYGAGDAKIGTIVGGNSGDGKRLKQSFLSKVPGLDGLVRDVKAGAKRGYLMGLSGRKLYVRSPHSALNVLLQSAGAYVMKYYLVLLNNKLKGNFDYAFVGNIHDEVQIQVKEEQAEAVAKIAEDTFADVTELLNFRCKLEGEAKIGDDWYGTH
jgi:DNA polymerase I-like protein with 3'-5' exonuclease and polymerase domains